MKYLPFIHPQLKMSDSVAVVGSAATLLDNEYGPEINQFEEVVRFNRAPKDRDWEIFHY